MIYQEIKNPEKIIYKDHFTDKDGNLNEEMPSLLVTVDFIEQEYKTRQVFTALFDSPETRKQTVEMGIVEGMGQLAGSPGRTPGASNRQQLTKTKRRLWKLSRPTAKCAARRIN